jgi:methyl-accepting chemotaxis protein
MKRGTLPVVMLVVIVAWALTAVSLLTGTLITAQRIDNRVDFVNAEVKPIDKDLDSVVLAVETGRIAGEINKAAEPLDDQLAQVVKFGDGIEVSAASVAERAKQINGNARAINSTVNEINSMATSINSTVGEINSGVDSIGTRIRSINSGVQSVNVSVDGINGSFDGILGETRSIDVEAAGINLRTDTVIGLSRAIKANTEDILEQAILINENAEAITESPFVIGGDGNGLLGLNQRAATALPLPGLAAPGVAGTDQQPSPNAPGESALPLPNVVPGLPTPALPAPDAPTLLPETGLLGSSGSDSGNLLGALG